MNIFQNETKFIWIQINFAELMKFIEKWKKYSKSDIVQKIN